MILLYSDGEVEECSNEMIEECSLLKEVLDVGMNEFNVPFPKSYGDGFIDFETLKRFWIFWSFFGNEEKLNLPRFQLLFTEIGEGYEDEYTVEMEEFCNQFERLEKCRHWLLLKFFRVNENSPSLRIENNYPYIVQFCEFCVLNNLKLPHFPIHSFFEYLCINKSKLLENFSIWEVIDDKGFKRAKNYFQKNLSKDTALKLYRGERLGDYGYSLLEYRNWDYVYWGERGQDEDYLKYLSNLLGNDRIINILQGCNSAIQIKIIGKHNKFTYAQFLVLREECLEYLIEQDAFENFFIAHSVTISPQIIHKISQCSSGLKFLRDAQKETPYFIGRCLSDK